MLLEDLNESEFVKFGAYFFQKQGRVKNVVAVFTRKILTLTT